MLIRLFILILILPLLAIVIVSPSTIRAQCTNTGKINVGNGLISAIDSSNFSTITDVNCVTGNRALIQQSDILDYDEMKTLYFDQAKSTITKTTETSGTETKINGSSLLYHITGNLTLGGSINDDIKVVFVDGNLYINTNLTNNDPKKGIVFVVKGSIYINRNIPLIPGNTAVIINAFLISHTGFCDAWDGTIPPASDGSNCIDNSTFATQQYLTINGSVISLNANSTPQFVRQKATETLSSETINYEPKYLVIMKDIFSRDLKIWREIQ